MRLENLTAHPDPVGNRIVLHWQNPVASEFTGVRVVRRPGTHPVMPDDGVLVGHAEGIESVTDTDLKAETVYYYSLFPFKGDPPDYFIDRHNRTAALATAPSGYADYMYELLPAIYHRYDTKLPPPGKVEPVDRQKGLLRRFLDISGGQLDQLHSYATAALDLHDLNRVDGRHLLPLLAAWIGWKTDYKLEIEGQRNEIRNAPALYHAIGLIPAVEATVKRISGWESRTKEFVHNVFASNRPERLNLWSHHRATDGTWSEGSKLLSLDYAYEGRATSSVDALGVRWLFYHTRRADRWEIWYKTSPTATLDGVVRELLVPGAISVELQDMFAASGLPITPDAMLSAAGRLWRVDDATPNEHYVIEPRAEDYLLYHTSAAPVDMAPSAPLVRTDRVNKYASLAQEGDTLWLFWAEYDSTAGKWRIRFRTRTDGIWSASDQSGDPSPFMVGGMVDEINMRMRPAAAVDRNGDLWLFWLEYSAGRWQLRYNRRGGGAWGASAQTFPLDIGADPRVEADPFILMQTAASGPMIYVFWARKAAITTPGQTRWEIAFRTKGDLNLDTAGWSPVRALSKTVSDDAYHDREPCTILTSAGEVELFWSSNRSGPWSLWHLVLSDLTVDADPSGAARIGDGPYSQRDVLALPQADGELVLVYRSNESLRYSSQVYGATATMDHRYAGSTTWHARNAAKRALTGQFEDFQTYTFDAGSAGVRHDDDWYARDTIGVYLDADTLDTNVVEAGIERLRPVVTEFMPATDRAVFIPHADVHTERVYTYGLPLEPGSRYIVSTHHDHLDAMLSDSALGPDIDFSDTLE